MPHREYHGHAAGLLFVEEYTLKYHIPKTLLFTKDPYSGIMVYVSILQKFHYSLSIYTYTYLCFGDLIYVP